MRAPPTLARALALARAANAAAAARSQPFMGASSSRPFSSSTSSTSETIHTTNSTGGLQAFVTPLDGDLEGVSALTLRRPAARNALGKQLLRELAQALDTLRQESTTRCVVVRSSVPGVFCAGADLKERAAMTQRETIEFVCSLRRTLSDLAALPMPTIAAVDGLALGGGMELALACDVRVASAGAAAFSAPEARLGVIPGAGGTQRLPRVVGASRAKELVFTCRRVGGAEAGMIGLVDHVVADDPIVEGGEGAGAVEAAGGHKSSSSSSSPRPHHPSHHRGFPAYRRALELAREIARAAPLSLRAAKAAVDQGVEVDLSSGLKLEEALYARLVPTRDRLEGLRAFAERRAPRFEGE
jgi:methylglutaconyl-CoA hydratase